MTTGNNSAQVAKYRHRVAASIWVFTAAMLLSGCPAKLPTTVATSITTGLPATGNIGSTYNGIVPTSGGGFTLTGITGAPWLTTVNLAAGTVSGTPDGNDFGAWTLVLTYTMGTTTRTVTHTITVADPTLTVDPTTGFSVAFHSNDAVEITLAPAPPTSYNYNYVHNILTGKANLTLTGPTSSTTGKEKLSLSWNFGESFTGQAFILIKTRAPGARVLRLGPIPSVGQ
jgi:hypothetical protein